MTTTIFQAIKEPVDEFFMKLKKQQKTEDRLVTSKQHRMKEGNCYIEISEIGDDLVSIFGKIVPLEDEEDLELFSKPHYRNIRYVWAASLMCPEGESGTLHVSRMHLEISPEMLEEARVGNWDPGVLKKWFVSKNPDFKFLVEGKTREAVEHLIEDI